MAFTFCDSMIHDYRTQGYVVFRQIVPVSLLRDLRRVTATAQQQVRAKHGPQAQRMQPLPDYDIDLKPFQDFETLPAIVDAVSKVLTPRHIVEGQKIALLVEPAEKPWCTNWHRDITIESNVPDREEFRRVQHDPLFFNQINAPLYEDNCTWYVPGSYLRENLPGEQQVSESTPRFADDVTNDERERVNLDYCRSMPRAVRLSMDAGDFAMYHPNGWHIGNYLPDRKRVTIHAFAPSPELLDWYKRWFAMRAAKAG